MEIIRYKIQIFWIRCSLLTLLHSITPEQGVNVKLLPVLYYRVIVARWTRFLQLVEFFTNSVQYKSVNIVNFVLAVQLEIN